MKTLVEKRQRSGMEEVKLRAGATGAAPRVEVMLADSTQRSTSPFGNMLIHASGRLSRCAGFVWGPMGKLQRKGGCEKMSNLQSAPNHDLDNENLKKCSKEVKVSSG